MKRVGLEMVLAVNAVRALRERRRVERRRWVRIPADLTALYGDNPPSGSRRLSRLR